MLSYVFCKWSFIIGFLLEAYRKNVLIGVDDCDWYIAVINDESIPPDRKAPIGTSEIDC